MLPFLSDIQFNIISWVAYIVLLLALTAVWIRHGWMKGLAATLLFVLTGLALWALGQYFNFPPKALMIHNVNNQIFITDKNDYISYDIRLVFYIFWAFAFGFYSTVKR